MEGYVYALTKDGKITKCRASEENRGKGRCKHEFHQLPGETLDMFIKRVCNKTKPSKTKITYLYECQLSDFQNNDELGGSQPKVANDKEFLKFDSIELDDSGKISYKYSYPSVQEVISASLLRNTDIGNYIKFADYHLGILIKDDNTESTMSISKDYKGNDTVEFFLSSNYGKSPNTIMSSTEYREDVLDGLNPNDFIINSIANDPRLNSGFGKVELQRNLQKQFYYKRVIDEVLGNYDVKYNPLNFVVTKNLKTGEVNIVSMDYGRCINFGDSHDGYSISDKEINNFPKINVNKQAFKEDCEKIVSRYYSVSEELGFYAKCTFDKLYRNIEKYNCYFN